MLSLDPKSPMLTGTEQECKQKHEETICDEWVLSMTSDLSE